MVYSVLTMASIPQSENFVHRLSEIPMVSASFEQASNIYRFTKSSNRYFESALNFVEALTKSAVETTQPILKVLDGPRKFFCFHLILKWIKTFLIFQ